MANKMKELAGIFGVELGEDFNLKDKDGVYLEYNPYRFTDGGIVDKDEDGINSMLCMQLIRGNYTIEKAPFVPKDGEKYWTCISNYNTVVIHSYYWNGNAFNNERRLLGVVFRTEKEAKDYLPTFKRRLEGEEV